MFEMNSPMFLALNSDPMGHFRRVISHFDTPGLANSNKQHGKSSKFNHKWEANNEMTAKWAEGSANKFLEGCANLIVEIIYNQRVCKFYIRMKNPEITGFF